MLSEAGIKTKLDELARGRSFSEFLTKCSTKIKGLYSQINYPYEIDYRKSSSGEVDLFYKEPVGLEDLYIDPLSADIYSDPSWRTRAGDFLESPPGAPTISTLKKHQAHAIIQASYIANLKEFLKKESFYQVSAEQIEAIGKYLSGKDPSKFLECIIELSNVSQGDKEQKYKWEESLTERLAATQSAFSSSFSCSSSSSSSSSSELLSSLPSSSSSESSSSTSPLLSGYALEQTQTQQPLSTATPTPSEENLNEEGVRGRKAANIS